MTPKGKTTSKIPIKKGSPSTSPGDDISRRLEAVRERRKTWEKHLAESGFAKGKGKGKGKGPAREVERLKPLPGWEDWHRGKKLRRGLDYDSDYQSGGAVDVQKWIAKTGKEFHWPGYQYMGPGTHLAKRLKRGDPGINRLDQIAKQHDIDYSRAKNLQDKWKADTKMIQAIDRLPGKKTKTERVVKKIMQTKKRLKL